MTDINLNELRGIAEAATPGPWKVETDDYEGSWVAFLSSDGERGDGPTVTAGALIGNMNYVGHDATHIATFDPPTVLALLSRLEAAEDGLFRVVQAIGEDMDGARNASEYFGPLTICTNPPITDPSGIAVHLVSAYRAEMEAENDAAEARLEASEKVIAEALAWMDAGDGRLGDHPLRRILSAYTKGTDRD